MKCSRIAKIISGGQTGADRAGLDAARLMGIETGGTAAKGWRICLEDGSEGSDPGLAEFGLVECSKPGYPSRTKQNVMDSDGTVWFGFADSPGGRLTISACRKAEKHLIVNPSSSELVDWVQERQISVLNVAGNRASRFNPNIYVKVFWKLWDAFGDPVPHIGKIYVNHENQRRFIVEGVGRCMISDRDTVLIRDFDSRECFTTPCDQFIKLMNDGDKFWLRNAPIKG